MNFMGNIVVSVQEQINETNGRHGLQSVMNSEMIELVADMQYRQCLSELGLTPEDLEGAI
jgi:hypothetical protein